MLTFLATEVRTFVDHNYNQMSLATLLAPFSMVLIALLSATFGVAQDETLTIGMLGCIRHEEPVPAFEKYAEMDADVYVWLGDNVYSDTDDPEEIRQDYAELAAQPYYDKVRRKGRHFATWDDHDYGQNNAGKAYIRKADSKAIFAEFWELEEALADREGVYHAEYLEHEGHTVQFLLLDVRYHRDDPFTYGDMLGEAQWQWLEEELRKPAELRFIVSGSQVLLEADRGSETWAQYPTERERLFDLIRNTGAEHTLFLTGDQHYGEVLRMPGALDFDAVELQFAGLNQIESPEFSSYRVSDVCRSKHSYASIDVQFEDSDEQAAHILYTIRNAETDALEVQYRVNFSELETTIEMPRQTLITDRAMVRLNHRYPDLQLRYTLDGSAPSANLPARPLAFYTAEPSVIKAQLFTSEGTPRSRVFEHSLNRAEARDAIETGELRNGLTYQYVEGKFKKLPDFEDEEVLGEGVSTDLDVLDIRKREDHYAIRFNGYLRIKETATYLLSITSDDGARLYLGEDLVLDNDGSHSARTVEIEIGLREGMHPVTIEYFEDYAGETLHLNLYNLDNRRPVRNSMLFFHD